MATVQAVTQTTGQQILANQQIPAEGPRCVPFTFDWTAGATYEMNMINFQNVGKISIIQGVWIDNSGNPNPATVSNVNTGQNVTCLGGWQGYFPIFAVNPVDLFASSPIGAYITKVTLYNVPIAPNAWPASASAGVTQVADAILDATVTNNRVQIKDASQYTPKGYQQLTITTAQSLTVPSGALYAWIGAQAQIARWRDDGTAPTAAIGIELQVGAYFWYDGNLATFQAISEAAAGVLNISYYA